MNLAFIFENVGSKLCFVATKAAAYTLISTAKFRHNKHFMSKESCIIRQHVTVFHQQYIILVNQQCSNVPSRLYYQNTCVNLLMKIQHVSGCPSDAPRSFLIAGPTKQRDPRVSLVLGECWLHKARDASASVKTYAKPRGKDVAPNLVRLLSTKGPPAVEGKPFKNAKNGQTFLTLAFSIGKSWTIKNVEFDSWGVRVPAHESCTKHHTCKLKEKRIEALLFLENPLTTLPSLQQVTHKFCRNLFGRKGEMGHKTARIFNTHRKLSGKTNHIEVS